MAQFLPGPASSQVGIGIGVMRAGILGGVVSFLGFTLPSVVALILFAILLTEFEINHVGWIHGLKIVAVVVVAHAIMGMAKKLTPDLKRKAIALFALITTLIWQTAFTPQVGVILIAALMGFLLFKHQQEKEEVRSFFPIAKSVSIISLLLFFALLFLLPIIKEVTGSDWIAMFDSFYRSGSLVFGGGHVVLPLLVSVGGM